MTLKGQAPEPEPRILEAIYREVCERGPLPVYMIELGGLMEVQTSLDILVSVGRLRNCSPPMGRFATRHAREFWKGLYEANPEYQPPQ